MRLFDQYKHLSIGVYIVAFSRFINTLGAFIWPLFTLILTSKVGLSEGEIAAFVSASMVLGLLFTLLGGYLADHIGRKRVIVIFEFIAILFFLSVAFVPEGMWIAYMLLFGQLAFSVTGPAHDSLMANITRTEERESAFSLIYLSLNVGIIVGPAVGGLLLRDHFVLFILIDVFTTFISYLLLVFFIKEQPDKVQTNEMEETVDVSIFKIVKQRPVILFYGLLLVVTSFAYGQLDLTLPLYVTSLFDDFERIYGFLYSTNGLTVVIFTVIITYVFRHTRALDKMMIGLGIYILSNVLYAFNTSLVGLYAVMVVFTLGEIIMSIGAGPIMSRIVPENLIGRVSGAISVMYILGHVLATMLSGTLLELDYSFRGLWLIVAGITSLGMVYFIWFRTKFGHIINKADAFDQNRTAN